MAPDLVVFDLDYTLWPCYCDTHLVPPFTPRPSDDGSVLSVVDYVGFVLTLFPDIHHILLDLYKRGVKVAAASRTHEPEIAKQLLRTFKLVLTSDSDPIALIDIFDNLKWGDRSKIYHIKEAVSEIYDSNVSLGSLQIFLFDDEPRNRDVETRGVNFVPVRPDKGATWAQYSSYVLKTIV